MAKLIPEVTVSDMDRSMQFYSTLGFEQQDQGIVDEKGSQWYSLTLGEATLWLLREDIDEAFQKGEPRGNGSNLYLSVDDVDAVYERVNNSGYKMSIVKDIATLWYGLRQFTVADPDGYALTINMPVPQQEEEAAAGNA